MEQQETEDRAQKRVSWMKRGAVGALAVAFVVVTALVAPRVKARTGLGTASASKGPPDRRAAEHDGTGRLLGTGGAAC